MHFPLIKSGNGKESILSWGESLCQDITDPSSCEHLLASRITTYRWIAWGVPGIISLVATAVFLGVLCKHMQKNCKRKMGNDV